MTFSRLPTWWIHNSKTNRKGLFESSILQKNFTAHGNLIGKNISALKCYLALVSHINFHTGVSTLTYSQLEEIAGLSRPMVCKGLYCLERNDLLKIKKDGRNNIYEIQISLADFDLWAKLPTHIIRNKLRFIPSRGKITLTALKIYLLLLAIRNNSETGTSAPYDYLEENLSIQRKYINKSLNLLMIFDFIDVIKLNSENQEQTHTYNKFRLKGINNEE